MLMDLEFMCDFGIEPFLRLSFPSLNLNSEDLSSDPNCAHLTDGDSSRVESWGGGHTLATLSQKSPPLSPGKKGCVIMDRIFKFLPEESHPCSHLLGCGGLCGCCPLIWGLDQ